VVSASPTELESAVTPPLSGWPTGQTTLDETSVNGGTATVGPVATV
jgi:hypothetical protein